MYHQTMVDRIIKDVFTTCFENVINFKLSHVQQQTTKIDQTCIPEEFTAD
jgi:hypothetical protein